MSLVDNETELSKPFISDLYFEMTRFKQFNQISIGFIYWNEIYFRVDRVDISFLNYDIDQITIPDGPADIEKKSMSAWRTVGL